MLGAITRTSALADAAAGLGDLGQFAGADDMYLASAACAPWRSG